MQNRTSNHNRTGPRAAEAYVTLIRAGEEVGHHDLDPARTTTVGRHPLCDIILDDTLISRTHCEILHTNEGWIVRDLGSRNGTFAKCKRLSQDWLLKDGHVIHLGSTSLAFRLCPLGDDLDDHHETVNLLETYVEKPTQVDLNPQPLESDTSIIRQTARSRYNPDEMRRTRDEDYLHGLSHLHRMAIRTASAQDTTELAEIILSGILDATNAEIGAVLLLPDADVESTINYDDMQQVAFETRTENDHHDVSTQLSKRAIAENQAISANYILAGQEGAGLSNPSDSIAELQARSVICAPIRRGRFSCGVLHVYLTALDRELSEDDLHLTLAAADHMGVVMDALADREQLVKDLAREQSMNQSLREHLHRDSLLIGETNSIRALREDAHRIAPTDATVLIRGESGVGKELVARTIHISSRRSDQPFVCVNCAALTESLLESELFGHEKGAFTGAESQKPGKFELADRGTLFLDEVGEMTPLVQSKFLRILENHPFERVGGTKPVNVDVRVVAATNRNLEKAVKDGSFRQDLYFRLQVMQMMVDPLRDRKADIPVLARFFLGKFAEKAGVPVKQLTPAAMGKLSDHHWPGNVRELQNTIERSLILSQDVRIDADDIRLSVLEGENDPVLGYNRTAQGQFREMKLEQLEQSHILATLDYTEWNKTRAAIILGIERSTLDRKLKRANISRPG